MLAPLFAAPYVAPLPRKLPYLLRMTIGERMAWPILAVCCVLLAPSYPEIMLVLTAILTAIMGLAGGLCLPAWMDIVARVTPLRMRGKLFGWSGAVSGLLGVIGGLGAERVLATYAYPYNFAACFAAASICLFISFLGLVAIREPIATERPASVPLSTYIGQLPGLLRRDHSSACLLSSASSAHWQEWQSPSLRSTRSSIVDCRQAPPVVLPRRCSAPR